MPHWLIRWVVRRHFLNGIQRQVQKGIERQNTQKRALIRKFKRSPIALYAQDANLQHYEVPTEFFQMVLGKRMKYSCCYWLDNVTSLDEAEEAMLRLTCERARIKDGMRVLDLGCGWGSLTLWIAEHYPNCEVLAVSNSSTQGAFVRAQAERLGFTSVQTLTANVADLELEQHFDRVLSIEMFEHMKNYEALMGKIAGWLMDEGLLFVHHFSHKRFAYEFDVSNPDDWMARMFFAGGTMPSDDLLLYFQQDLKVISHWVVSGSHYARTLRAWWDRMHEQQDKIMPLVGKAYGMDSARQRYHHWSLFFLITEETWKLRGGEEYVVTHLLFEKPKKFAKRVREKASS
jgi:cyclopropane-fatty-acyl-phospholipid synthase